MERVDKVDVTTHMTTHGLFLEALIKTL